MREVITRIRDDFDHSEDADEVAFVGYNGKWYMLDLTTKRGDELRGVLGAYFVAGTMVPADQVAGKPHAVTARALKMELNARIRSWASAQEPPLPIESAAASGYIPATTRKAYDLAHSPSE